MENKINKIEVLGSGCPTCKQLFEATKKVVGVLKIDTSVEYINDVTKIIEMGVMSSPVLAINGKPVLTGGGHSEADIKNALEKNLPINNQPSSCCSCGGNC